MKKIFIIEDDNLLNSILSEKFSEHDFEVNTFKNAMDCFTALETKIPDIILTDLFLPGMSGIEMVQNIKADDKYKNLSLLAVSNTNNQSDIDTLTSLNIPYMIKAIASPDDIFEKVEQILNKKDSHTQ